jgi:dTDP-glucose 4,6-dehydratase
MGTLIVTGGAGFIGSNFVRRALASTTHRVVVFDKLTYAGSLSNLEELASNAAFVFVRGDIADREAVRKLFDDHAPTALLNFAAESHVDRSIDDAAAFIRTNVTGTYELLEAARSYLVRHPAQAAGFRFIQISTDEVFGSIETGAFSESTPARPNSPYAASKAAADHLARAWRQTYGLPIIVTNCSNNYGPRQFPEKLIPLILLNALEGRPLPIYGDGGNVRDWLYVDDHCDALLKVLAAPEPAAAYTIGGSCERTNLALIDALCEELERQRPARDNPRLTAQGVPSYRALRTFVPDRPGHDRRYAIDSSKIRQELGWAPEHDLASGLAATVSWYLSHLDWCDTVQAGKYDRQRLGLGGL